MAIEIKINSAFDTETQTAQRIFELLTENTGTHFMDSGGENGRHWQRNQGHTLEEWLARPSAILETEWSTYPILDLFGFLNARLTLTETAKQLQDDFDKFMNDDEDRSPYYISDMEQWANTWHDNRSDYGDARIGYSYNWENFLSQDIQYLNFEHAGQSFVLLQVHGGADARGGFTRPQVFEVRSPYWAHDMTDAIIQCTAQPCRFSLEIRGITDICDGETGAYLESGALDELKVCPKCSGTLEAIAPEPIEY
jgi:hypothetical protein